MSHDEPEKFAKFVRDLNNWHDPAVRRIIPVLGDDFQSLECVTPVEHRDGTPVALDVRYKTKSGEKAHRLVFLGLHVDPADKRSDVKKFRNKFEVLAKYDLLLPIGLPEAFAAQDEAKAEGKRALFYFCEGSKTRRAIIEHRLPQLAKYHEKEGLIPAVLATVCGLPGILKTNYAARPLPKIDPVYERPGINDIALDLKSAEIRIVIDNDAAGREEGRHLSFRLQNDYGVSVEAIGFVDPPESAVENWDDAEKLPWDVTPEMRLQHFMEPRREIGWETEAVPKSQGGGIRIIQDSNRNRLMAVQRCGASGYIEMAAGGMQFLSGGKPFPDNFNAHDKDQLADQATRVMGHVPTRKNTEDWHRTWRDLAGGIDTARDLLHEEIMAIFDQPNPSETKQ